jgi:hypothetical protein
VIDSERAHEPEQPGGAPEAHAREPQAPTVPAPTPVAEAPVAETSVAEAPVVEAPVVEAQNAKLALEAPLTERSSWPAELATLAKSASEWLKQPRVRLSLTGTLLLLIGGLLMTSSVWTFPLVIVGALMVAIAWIGHRLEGRFAVEWGQTGTQLAFRATIKAAHLGHDAAIPAAVQTIDGPHGRARPRRAQGPDRRCGEHPGRSRANRRTCAGHSYPPSRSRPPSVARTGRAALAGARRVGCARAMRRLALGLAAVALRWLRIDVRRSP